MAYRFTMELGEAALEVNLLAWLELVWAALTVGSGAAGVAEVGEVMVEVRDGLTGTAGSTLVWGCWREVLRAGTGAGAVVVVLAGLAWLAAVVVVVLDGVVTALAVETAEVVASLALFSALIRSISSSSLAAAPGLAAGVTAGLGAAGLGAGGGVSFFLGRVSSISCSWG